MKYYAVKTGRTPGVYRTWEDAKKQVDGFSGAEYKSFEKITDATEYLNWNKETQPDIVKEDSLINAIQKIRSTNNAVKAKNKKVEKKASSDNPTDYFATIYTDGGSRNTGVHKGGHVNKTDRAAWAYLIEWEDGRTYGSGGEFGATNNKMELLGLINALEKLI
ncbi:MAG: ribonuclease H family protein, partial [Lactobacillus sp.]|nr:ribonuclease H family protein [Lactobacillus sp.]